MNYDNIGCSLPALWVQGTEDDRVDCVVSPEKQPAGANRVCVDMWTCSCISVWTSDERAYTHFLWLSVSVMPCADTLKWTAVDAGGGSMARVSVVAF